ncbi:MAG TPA: DNA-binding protein [Burkholderiaceae bacterium]|nr:DNA-binding protein [Burkholderiaceae bacterium]
MARGITETDVWKACDALLLEGARPTIERVRLKIGRGSPNTVSPHLEAWFKHLGGRIQDPGAFAAPPDVPDPVLQAARHFWETALALTRRDFDQRLQEAMAAAVANVESEKERAAIAEAAAFEAAGKAARLQHDLAERTGALEQERLARAGIEANLADAHRQVQDLQRRLERSAAELAEVRESARRDVAVAQERSAAAERRAALEIESERSARSKADKRADALERKLDQVHTEARAEQTRQVQLAARLHADVTRLTEEGRRMQAREASLTQRLTELEGAVADREREVHAARAQAALAERLVASLKPRALRRKVRAAGPS